MIDFEDSSYLLDGLFAITGPTGAGKSTILDAICLALFGKTPRQPKVNKATNELMSRQTADCMAEVTFETGKGIYRCSFSQKRARNKPDGKLQEVSWDISDAQTNKVLASRAADMQKKVPEILGMDYEQFTRAVVLAQGQFKEFLEAKADERAALLEKITGTEIYSTISRTVYAKTSEQKRLFDELSLKLGEIRLLDADQLAALTQEMANCSASLEKIRPDLEQLGKQIQKLDERQRLDRDWSELKAGTEANEAAIAAFVPQQEQLKAHEKALPLVADFRLLERARLDLKALLDRKQSTQTRIQTLTQKIEQQQNRLGALQTVQSEATLAYESQIPTLRMVRTLDAQIQTVRDQINRLNTNQAEIRAFLQQWSDQPSERLDQCDAQLEEQIRADQANERLFLGELSIGDYNNLVETFEQTRRSWEKLRDCQTWIRENQDKRAEIKQNIEKTEKVQESQRGEIEKYQRHADLLEIELGKLADIIELSARVAALAEQRQALEDGVECPLCGSKDHPYCTKSVPESSKEKVRQTEAKKEQRTIQKQLSAALGTWEGAKKSLEIYRRQLEELDEQLKSLTGLRESLRKPIHADADISIREIDWRQECIGKKIVQTKQLVQQAQNCQIRQAYAQDFRIVLTGLKLKAARKLQFGDANPDNVETELKRKVDQAAQELNQCDRTLAALATDIVNAQQTFDQLLKESQSKTSELEDREQRFAAQLTAVGFTDQPDFERAQLTAPVAAALRRKADELQTQSVRLVSLRESLQKRQDQLDKDAPIDQKSVDEKLSELQSKQKELQEQSEELIRRSGQVERQIQENEENRRRFDIQKKERDAQESEFQRWSKLNALIGNQDGQKYRKIVQRMSLEILLSYANEQLAQLSDRFVLTLLSDQDAESSAKADDSLLSLYCIDNYQASEVRPTSNLSGGESFLVSLSLALGLSRMSSANVSIDSLFLDEGFGTLDEQTLQTALEALVQFQTSGTGQKIIGIISHVETLKDRIVNKIEVVPARAGVSRLKGPGVKNE